MTSWRSVRSIVIAFVILGSACSPTGSSPSGDGGSQGGGGLSGQAGTSAGGGQSGTGAPGTAGTSSQGGTTGGGGQAGTAGASDTGGRAGAGTGGAATAGQSGSTGVGTGGIPVGSGGAGATGSGGRGGAGARGGAGGGTGGGSGGVAGGSGGGAGATGSAGAGGASQSAGCGKTRTLQNGTITITFNNASRTYILRVPDNYDNKHAYRLLFAYAESGSSAMSVATRNYFTMAALDTGKTTIFVAPEAVGGAGSWSKSDVELTDAILAQLEGDLCIDRTRIFATGFSFGGAMSLALACQRADVFRGVAFFSGADLTGSCTGTLTKPIAYYASQASQDSTGDPAPTSGRVKQAQFAAVNGCTAEPSATTFPAAGQPHTCTNYKGCSAGHPTEYCVFDGPHGWEPKDPGQSTSWNAPEAWKFITQF
jgi:poly(3-hydroxybutyrate) depolymerase